ncbi:MAG: hypothetical protein D6706_13820, partial [Chloroflexi bacterium]
MYLMALSLFIGSMALLAWATSALVARLGGPSVVLADLFGLVDIWMPKFQELHLDLIFGSLILFIPCFLAVVLSSSYVNSTTFTLVELASIRYFGMPPSSLGLMFLFGLFYCAVFLPEFRRTELDRIRSHTADKRALALDPRVERAAVVDLNLVWRNLRGTGIRRHVAAERLGAFSRYAADSVLVPAYQNAVCKARDRFGLLDPGNARHVVYVLREFKRNVYSGISHVLPLNDMKVGVVNDVTLFLQQRLGRNPLLWNIRSLKHVPIRLFVPHRYGYRSSYL